LPSAQIVAILSKRPVCGALHSGVSCDIVPDHHIRN